MKISRYLSLLGRNCMSPAPSRISKISKICPDRDLPGTKTLYWSDKYQTKPRSKR